MKKPLELKPLFLERMKSILSNEKDFQNYLKAIESEPPVSIRCNTLKISPEDLKERLNEKGWEIKQPFKGYPEIMIVGGKFSNKNSDNEEKNVNDKSHDNISDNKDSSSIKNSSGGVGGKKLIPLEPGELGRALEHLLGYYYVQEIASMLPVLALNPKSGELVLDLCASPGSKTTQIAAKMENTGTIIANEVSLGRVKILASNTERCGVTNVVITKKEGTALCKRLKNSGFSFDKILIDAPCSGEGTLRSTPRTAIMWNINTVKKLSKIQKHLLEAALEVLKPNGDLVYSTCTHAPEENEEVVDFVLKEFSDKVKIEKINLPVKCRNGLSGWAGGEYNHEVTKSCRIYPQDSDTEGFFIAKFRRVK
ncbi:RsmB/NOP family class I SAM-dependent RNA methyltransferase [Candidatus Pacearchaeota archaeon]|nr:RsmB/NOP family class I SAM-dependent RNA methyltransferase [Candidatus Pacearchaeota archaeon]